MSWQIPAFGIENLRLSTPGQTPMSPLRPDEGRIDVRAWSLNFRDLIIVSGLYPPPVQLPTTPLSDAAGVVSKVGTAVTEFAVGDRVVTHAMPAWDDGPYVREHGLSMLGMPG